MKNTIVTAEVHSLDQDDTLVVATQNSANTITLRYYDNVTNYQNNQAEYELNLTHEFLQEILRVFPCLEV